MPEVDPVTDVPDVPDVPAPPSDRAPVGSGGEDGPDTDRWLNLPNALSALRLVLVPVFVSLSLAGRPVGALVTFVVAGVTDGIDGYLARRWNQRTALGAHLDPLADKLLTLAAFALLAYRDVLPWWLLGLAVLRDVGLVAGHAWSTYVWKIRAEVEPSFLGKLNTTVQIVTLSLGLGAMTGLGTGASWGPALAEVVAVLGWVTGASILASGGHYAHREWRLLRQVRAEALPPAAG